MLIKSDLFHYFLLIIILFIGVYFYVSYAGSGQQFVVVCLTSAAYVLWGIFHHAVYERLQLWIITEYLLIASLVVAFFAFSLNLR
jgi:hypothetical protein